MKKDYSINEEYIKINLMIKKEMPSCRGEGSIKKSKWQYHKNPEAGSTDHQVQAAAAHAGACARPRHRVPRGWCVHHCPP